MRARRRPAADTRVRQGPGGGKGYGLLPILAITLAFAEAKAQSSIQTEPIDSPLACRSTQRLEVPSEVGSSKLTSNPRAARPDRSAGSRSQDARARHDRTWRPRQSRSRARREAPHAAPSRHRCRRSRLVALHRRAQVLRRARRRVRPRTIDHAERYVDGRVHTNGIENFWSLVKRGLHGTNVSVEPYHLFRQLFRYLDERVFTFNLRERTDYGRFEAVLDAIGGRRLTYAEVTG